MDDRKNLPDHETLTPLIHNSPKPDSGNLQKKSCFIDSEGVLKAVHFNNRSADWLDAPADVAEAWYQAYRQFAQLLLRDELQLVFRLAPGDCVVMQNDRTLHGRTAFDPNLGRRHLQGCYIDRDGMESRRLVLRRTLNPA